MKLPMITTRLRVHHNSPPLTLFNPIPVRQKWLQNGHQTARTVTQKKLVINSVRKKEKSYNCTIYY